MSAEVKLDSERVRVRHYKKIIKAEGGIYFLRDAQIDDDFVRRSHNSSNLSPPVRFYFKYSKSLVFEVKVVTSKFNTDILAGIRNSGDYSLFRRLHPGSQLPLTWSIFGLLNEPLITVTHLTGLHSSHKPNSSNLSK